MLENLSLTPFGKFLLAKKPDRNPWGAPWPKDEPKSSDKKPEETAQPKQPDFQPNPQPNQKPNSQPKAESIFDKAEKKFQEFSKKFSSGNNGGNGSNGGSNNGSNNNQNNVNPPKSVVGLVILALISLWLLSGFYKVDADENAAVLYFGKFYKISTPGLNYHIPYPFGEIVKRSVTAVNTEEFGFSSSKNAKRNFDAESLMLTGDENIVDIEFQVQWQVADIKDFVFNVAEVNQTIRKSAESAMREVIARTPIAKALSDGKQEIEQETRQLLQETLDSYGAGVLINLVQLLRVDPPVQVREAFLDVQAARADKEKEINQAQAYANDIIPRARGTASVITQEAEAYNQQIVTKAQGESERFISVYTQYMRSKPMTRKRIYIDTMEQIYRDMDKVFIDKGASRNGVVPYFPMNDITNSKAAK